MGGSRHSARNRGSWQQRGADHDSFRHKATKTRSCTKNRFVHLRVLVTRVAARLEEDPDPELDVAGLRDFAKSSEVRVVSLSQAIQLEPFHRRDVERVRVTTGKRLRQLNVEEVQRQGV